MNGVWLIRGRDGRLSVYWHTQEAVLCRAERIPGGSWDAPRRVGGDQKVQPGFALGQGPDRYGHLIAWRPTRSGESGLVHSTHFRPLLAALDWQPIGHPNKTGERTGTPAVAVDAEGRAYLFVRNRGKGVHTINQKERGGWNTWHDLKGSKVGEELVAVTAESGLVEVYATSPTGVLRWLQEEPGARPLAADPLDVRIEPGTLNALPTSKEHTTLFFSDPEGMLHAWRPDGDPVPLIAAAGPGPVSTVRCDLNGHDCTLLAQRSSSGRVAFAAYPTEQESAGLWWTESGPALPAGTRVAVVEDAEGRVAAASLTPDGVLRVARQKDEPGLALAAWREV
ncbi:hypothetical protein BN159_2397 [Streptomyces davaonensis JCM 4913]|uniref:PLL-like beta propeller domain-containing protein n=1 Tax=Streptomyces davaonensis (strain DSM 101723 / JCM 4913 / KCC S-0913 / 768) TaxID=1214101 RepID=K4QTP8_STRDJ|nr:hypothetical protein [Streptomyces davaonensis]CCK26776.1 hypothetical protein BN159_2397 [Streptomyces davaonensis JCM 4913]